MNKEAPNQVWPTPSLAFPTAAAQPLLVPTTRSLWANPFCLDFSFQQQLPSPNLAPLDHCFCLAPENCPHLPPPFPFDSNNTGLLGNRQPIDDQHLCQPGPASNLCREYPQLPTPIVPPPSLFQNPFIECLPPSESSGAISAFSPSDLSPDDRLDLSRMSNSNWDYSGLPLPRQTEPNSDDYLHALVTNDFSSPSLPPLSPRLLRPHSDYRRALQRQAEVGLIGDLPTTTNTTNGVNNSGASHNPIHIDLDHTSSSPPPSLSPVANMPSTRAKRTREASIADASETYPAKRRRSSRTPARPTISTKRLPATATSSASIFAETLDDDSDCEAGIEIVDLAGIEEIPQKPVLEPKEDNNVKLGGFQCVICMDDVTALSVTYCG